MFKWECLAQLTVISLKLNGEVSTGDTDLRQVKPGTWIRSTSTYCRRRREAGCGRSVMGVSKILLQVPDLIEMLVYVLLLKVSILILENILHYEELHCMVFTVTSVHILLQEQLSLSTPPVPSPEPGTLYECS